VSTSTIATLAVFYIFRGKEIRHATWLDAVTGYGDAQRRMCELAEKVESDYFMISLETREVVDSVAVGGVREYRKRMRKGVRS